MSGPTARPPEPGVRSRLIVVADPSAAVPADDGHHAVLRLAGVAAAGEIAPPDLLRAADRAAAEVRAHFPQWLWDWTIDSGALSLTRLAGAVSWWWLAPISEKSCARSRLIHELYWLTLLGGVLDANPEIASVRWLGDDALLATVAERLVTARGLAWHASIASASQARRGLGRLALRRAAYTAYAAVRWAAVRAVTWAIGAGAPDDADAVFFTRFPSAWETGSAPWQDRMYGSLPADLAAAGHRCLFAASTYGSVGSMLAGLLRARGRTGRIPLLHLETQLGLLTLLRSHLTIGLFARYLRLRRRRRGEPVEYGGADVAPLLWRELDESVFSPEIATCVATCAALRALLTRLPGCRTVFTSFEYQPIERAVAVAVHTASTASVVGTQAAMYNANQMGWNLYPPELERAWDRGDRVHQPDLVCAYGDLAGRVFAAGLGERAVAVVGGIRYPTTVVGPTRLSADALVLVAVPSVRSEALAMIETVARTFATVEVPVRIKFHPLLSLRTELARIASRWPGLRYEVVDRPVASLLDEAAIAVCGSTSVSIEAIVHGAMPLVFRPTGELGPDPSIHVPEAIFAWNGSEQLRAATLSCLDRDAGYTRRVSAWPQAIAEHLHRADGDAVPRVIEALANRGILPGAAGAPAADDHRAYA